MTGYTTRSSGTTTARLTLRRDIKGTKATQNTKVTKILAMGEATTTATPGSTKTAIRRTGVMRTALEEEAVEVEAAGSRRNALPHPSPVLMSSSWVWTQTSQRLIFKPTSPRKAATSKP